VVDPMTGDGGLAKQRPWWVRILATGFGFLAMVVVGLWAIEVVDRVVFDQALQRNGIGPRRIDGLDGVLWAPLLHSDWDHLFSNSVPLLVLGWLTMLRGFRYWLAVTIGTALFGGFLVWLFGGGVNHIGASGVVFGYFGALTGAAVRSRKPATLAPALVAIFLYGTMLVGIIPQDDISWESHLFGLIVGFVLAMRLVPRPIPENTDEIMYPWEIDEPWRVTEQEPEDGK
jgi:membrane associated rhomboid family serine protease